MALLGASRVVGEGCFVILGNRLTPSSYSVFSTTATAFTHRAEANTCLGLKLAARDFSVGCVEFLLSLVVYRLND